MVWRISLDSVFKQRWGSATGFRIRKAKRGALVRSQIRMVRTLPDSSNGKARASQATVTQDRVRFRPTYHNAACSDQRTRVIQASS
jgi:hypothetical protein